MAAEVNLLGELEFSDWVTSLDCHPSEEIFVSGLINGEMFLCKRCSVDVSQSESGNSREDVPWNKTELPAHSGSCRVTRFSKDGQSIYSSSRDRSLSVLDVESQRVVRRIHGVHASPVYSMHVTANHKVVTGDDGGHVKFWDMRQDKCVSELKENSDFISDFATSSDRSILLFTSGDGTLSCCDLRKKSLLEKSDQCESELLCVEIVKGETKVVVGDGEGVIGLYTWNLWGDVTDRFTGHPQSVDCMVKVSPSVVCTGCMDGSVRACQILPNRILTEIGSHGDGLPVSNVAIFSGDENNVRLVSSAEHGVRLWSLNDALRKSLKRLSLDSHSSDSSEEEEKKRTKKKKTKKISTKIKRKRNKHTSSEKGNTAFFSDL